MVQLTESERAALVRSLEASGVIRSASVRDAMLSVPRELFVWEGYRGMAYVDSPLPLGRTGQTISAPHMVAIMLEELELSPGQKVLEVGCGSGYNAACISRIIGSSGKLVSVELNPELAELARKNLAAAGVKNVDVELGDGSLGFPPRERREVYDRIVVTAAANDVPEPLILQLKAGGIMLIPVGRGIQVLTKIRKGRRGDLTSNSVCECVFVPLLGGAS